MRRLLTCLLLALFALPAHAQNSDARIDRLERDLQLLQKSIYRDGNVPAPSSAGSASLTPEIARMEVRFQQVEERISMLEGRLEQLEYENRTLRETLERFQKDVELRFSDLDSGTAPTLAPYSPLDKREEEPETEPAEETPSQPEQVLKLPDENAVAAGRFDTPREHYNHAFRLLTQTQYDEAGAAFDSFIKAHPKDPLIGNAYYWAGETHYVRQNFIQAADYFRQGFEALPEGPKAGDNLLKLAMALSAIDRGTEACVVLKQVLAKFGGNSITLKKKATEERNRIGCK